ncbi:hypothetical protein B0H19DRAFT_1079962 [Mycena capillaripes]|nr:hypothetical protein B0H19DRAFT_1079962 [Mycena capillaripes]
MSSLPPNRCHYHCLHAIGKKAAEFLTQNSTATGEGKEEGDVGKRLGAEGKYEVRESKDEGVGAARFRRGILRRGTMVNRQRWEGVRGGAEARTRRWAPGQLRGIHGASGVPIQKDAIGRRSRVVSWGRYLGKMRGSSQAQRGRMGREQEDGLLTRVNVGVDEQGGTGAVASGGMAPAWRTRTGGGVGERGAAA